MASAAGAASGCCSSWAAGCAKTLLASTLVNALEYYWFGHALLAAGTWLKVVLIGAGIAWMVISFGLLRRRALRHLQAAAAAGESR